MSTYTAEDFKLNAERSPGKFQPKVCRTSKRLAKKKLQKQMMGIAVGVNHYQHTE